MLRYCKYRAIILTVLLTVVLALFSGMRATAGVLTDATLTKVINAEDARPGIGIGGVIFDAAANRLFLVGDVDANTPKANFFKFTVAGAAISETLIPGGTIGAISEYPGSSDLTISQGFYSTIISRITRDGAVVRSRTLSGMSVAGLALNPKTGRLWAAESAGATDTLRELDADFNVLRTLSVTSLLPGENILGLEIDPLTGNFLAAVELNGQSRLVEFDPGVTTILSSMPITEPEGVVATSLSIGGPLSARKLFVSANDPSATDFLLEFQLDELPSVQLTHQLTLRNVQVSGDTVKVTARLRVTLTLDGDQIISDSVTKTFTWNRRQTNCLNIDDAFGAVLVRGKLCLLGREVCFEGKVGCEGGGYTKWSSDLKTCIGF
jgi:hypothetical protein